MVFHLYTRKSLARYLGLNNIITYNNHSPHPFPIDKNVYGPTITQLTIRSMNNRISTKNGRNMLHYI